MTDHTTVIVDWRGPYEKATIKQNSQWSNGLYLASGLLKHKQTEEVQYCGITEGSFATRFANHHAIPQIARKLRIWIGEVSYPQQATRHYLEIAESILIYFWQPELNDKKTVYPPKPVTLINRWYKPDRTPRYRQHPMCKEINDVLSWDGQLWRTGNLVVADED